MSIEESLDFSKGNLYSPFPIPAYQVLARARKYNAQKVLMALVSHMGYNSRCVWPTYTRIASVAGLGRQSISNGLSDLVEFGFIKIFHYREGKKERSKYYLQGACWNPAYMNSLARQFRVSKARCLACLLYVERSDYGFSGKTKVHYGCGGIVLSVAPRVMPRNQVPYRDIIREDIYPAD